MTMQHGQQLGGLVESILAQLGYEPSIVADAHLCCGSAGFHYLDLN
jgi:glycolate oxidase iron-sulfur subunit